MDELNKIALDRWIEEEMQEPSWPLDDAWDQFVFDWHIDRYDEMIDASWDDDHPERHLYEQWLVWLQLLDDWDEIKFDRAMGIPR